MTKKLTLQIEDLEDRIAPSLCLPNGHEIFAGDMLHGEFHPGLSFLGARADAAVAATIGHGPVFVLPDGTELGFLGNVGPWSAHIMSPAIDWNNCS